jgi:hypothetical protein
MQSRQQSIAACCLSGRQIGKRQIALAVAENPDSKGSVTGFVQQQVRILALSPGGQILGAAAYGPWDRRRPGKCRIVFKTERWGGLSALGFCFIASPGAPPEADMTPRFQRSKRHEFRTLQQF